MEAGRSFEFLFQLSAKLGPNFSQSFKNAQRTMSVLQSDLANANKKLKDVSAYQKQQTAVAKSRDRVNELQVEHERLTREIEEAGQATPELTRKLQTNEKVLKNAREAVEKGEDRLNSLSEALREAGIDTDNLGRDTEELRRNYERLEQSQKRIQDITEKQNKNSETISRTKGQIAGTIGTVTALAGSFFALDAATEEYRNNQAKLNTAFQAAGLSTDAAKQAYAGFYKILGDDDTATEASQLLAKLALSEADVSKWTDIAAGVYGTFGDSLPIEGLIESANETARTGTITGSFADAINWASKEGETFGVTLKENTKANEEWNKAVEACESAEDYFNLALQSCGSEAERNQLIMNTLQGTYQDAAAAFKENNKQIIQNRQAQVIWNDILGKTGQIASTVKGMIIEMLGVSEDGSVKANSALSLLQNTLGKLADNPELIKTIAKTVALLAGLRVGGLVAKLGFLQVKGGILSVQKAFTMMKGLGITKYLSSLGGGFGGIITKVAPLVGVIAAVGGAVYYVSTHLEQVRGFIQKAFGDAGLAVFDKLWGIITQVGTAIKNAFFTSGSGVLDTLAGILPTIISTLQTGLLSILPVIADVFMQILPLIGQLVAAVLPILGELLSAVVAELAPLIAEILPVIVQLISEILPLVLQVVQSVLPLLVRLINAVAPLLIQIVQAVLPVIIQLIQTILPLLMQIIQAVLPVIVQLIQTILPLLMQIIQAVLPVIVQLIQTILPLLMQIIQAVLPVLTTLLQALIPVIEFVANVLSGVLGSALQSIVNIVGSVMQIFQGLIDFITGVFIGNWSQAWEGIKSIFSGAVGGLGEIIKAPLRAVVSAVNSVISGLNKLKIPDWVPGLGGKGINIPMLPGFAKGTDRTPSTFIAGENGPELITDAANRKVFTAAQTGQIFNNMAQAGNLNTANNVNATAGGVGTITIHVTNSPSVTVAGGGDTNGIKEQLQQYDEEFLEKLREIIRMILKEQREQEGRVAYA
jgi:phage-related protein